MATRKMVEEIHTDKVERYEKSKYKKFVGSSRLEGIILPDNEPTESLVDVIARHQQQNIEK